MWLVLQPILVIGMLWNDKLFVAAIMAALAARFTSRLLYELDPDLDAERLPRSSLPPFAPLVTRTNP